MTSGQPVKQPSQVIVDSIFLHMQPANYSRQYWLWRSERDVLKLDLAYAVMTICRVASSAYVSTVPIWCLLLLLILAALQLAMITRWTSQYTATRLGVVCWLRVAWLCFSCFAFKGIQTSSPTEMATAVGGCSEGQEQHTIDSSASATAATDMAVLFAAVSQLVNLAVQPVLQLIPFVVQLPFQVVGVALLLYNFHSIAFAHVDALPALAALLHSLHAVFEGIFHVSTGFVFLTPDVLAGCQAGDLRLVANFIAVYVGLVLPMFFTYKTELVGKACFVLSSICGQAGSVHVGNTGSSSSTRGAGETVPAAAAGTANDTDVDGQGIGDNGTGTEMLQLVGPLQPIHRDHLLVMLHSPKMRLKDDVICSVLLLIITWGVCLWATPNGL